MKALAPLLLVLLLAGCASEPRVMRLEADAAESARLFPPPETQEVPRYRYLGQLLGETNFKAANGNRPTGRRLLEIIVGLDEAHEKPVVLQRPQAGTVDATGRVIVTDGSRAAVFVFDEANGRMDLWERASAEHRFELPVGVAMGRGGEVLVADATLARVFRLAPDGTPRGEFGRGLLVRPTGLARDAKTGRVFVADTHAHDIKVFDDDGKHLATWGRRGSEPGELNFPTHLAMSNGTLLVCDSLNARVQGFDAQGRATLQLGERGMYVGNLVRPKGVAADDEGNVYVIESMYDMLLVFDREGRFLLSLGGTGAEAGRFYLPAGVWTDTRNRVFVADMFNGRVAVFQFLGGE
ncbi:MAG: 6-bladed beta-propeller [Burkholderiales bacterium]|nr:6-bladed beta-propeller [Burkholderiales bacterium]